MRPFHARGPALALAVLALLALAITPGCGSSAGSSSSGDGGTGGTDPGPDAGTQPGQAGPAPYGLAAMTSLDRLAVLRPTVRGGQTSSYDRTGGNADGFGASNYLYTDPAGEKVMADLVGPGCVYVLWFTGYDPATAWLKVYIDGETTPRINKPIRDLVAGTQGPFTWPLALDDWASSGGMVLALPIPFAHSIRITTNGAGQSFFYHVDYQLFSPDREVKSWTGGEDAAQARALWNDLGARPTQPAEGERTDTGMIDVPAGKDATLAELDGAGEITALRLQLPGLAGGEVTDSGRAHKGSSTFHMRIAPDNQGVILTRRTDHSIADQVAEVSVDGVDVGPWKDLGADAVTQWRDSAFTIPAPATAGKSDIAVTVTFVSSSNDWNEFEYRAYSIESGEQRLTDVLDVGNNGAEAAHGYTIAGETFSGFRTFRYPAGEGARDLLDNLRLVATWDDRSTPAIDVPLGAFFGVGQFGAGGPATSLLVGMDSSGALYAYFPMPFSTHAHLALASDRATDTTGVSFSLSHGPLPARAGDLGYFQAAYQHQIYQGGDGRDVQILDVGGTGHLVGVLESLSGPTNRGYLEGDERIYIDGSRTPVYQGTGSEDFYQAGWYFLHGPFSRATNGNPVHLVEGQSDETVAYRMFVPDVIPFRNGIHVGVEHGDGDNVSVEAWTVAWYYHRDADACAISDELDVGDAQSEADHDYGGKGETFSGSRSYTFEGDDDATVVDEDGRAHTDPIHFTLKVGAARGGVILRRMFDQGVTSPPAEVRVDGKPVGTWYAAGTNGTHRWREDDFYIPAGFTGGKGAITVEIRPMVSGNDWNEFRYTALSCGG